MQFIQFQICDFNNSNAPIPFGKCTVYLTGTATLAALFNSSGGSISNPATAGSNAQVGFAAPDGVYDYQFGYADATPAGPKVLKQQFFDLSAIVAPTVATRTALAALSATNGMARYLSEAGREGYFKFNSANLSTNVTADPQQGRYVPPASAPTGASGAWVRVL